MTRTSSCVFWIKVGCGAAHKAGFEDISTAAVREETTLIEVHLLPRGLEVQSDHLAATIPHILRIIVGGLEALAGGVDPAQLPAVVPYKKLSRVFDEPEGFAF